MSTTLQSSREQTDEGIASIAVSKLADLARGFVFKARPIIILHNVKLNSTATIKLKRGLFNHVLVLHIEGKGDKQIGKSPSSIYLMTKALNESRRLLGQGYVEI